MHPSRHLYLNGALRSAFVIGLITCLSSVASMDSASAQYPVIITPPQPALPTAVGYVPERRGVFGQRVIMRPVVAPLAVVPSQVAVASVPVPASTTAITVSRPMVVARPALAVPTSVPPPVVPAGYTSYYAPPAAVAPPTITPMYVLPPAPRTNFYIPPSWTY